MSETYIYLSTKFRPAVTGHRCLRPLALTQAECKKIVAAHRGWGGLFTQKEFKAFVDKQARGTLRSCLQHLGVKSTNFNTPLLKKELVSRVASDRITERVLSVDEEAETPEGGETEDGEALGIVVESDNLTVAQLKQLLDQMGVEYPKKATKPQLLELLEAEATDDADSGEEELLEATDDETSDSGEKE